MCVSTKSGGACLLYQSQVLSLGNFFPFFLYSVSLISFDTPNQKSETEQLNIACVSFMNTLLRDNK